MRHTVEQLGPDLIGIAELLQEASVLWDTLDTERLVLTSDGVDEVVVRDSDRSRLGGDIRQVLMRLANRFCHAADSLPLNVTVLATGSTSWASASYTETFLFLCRVMYLVGWMILLASSVPTVTEGSRGEKRK
jgi:hypothetical protein